MKNLLQRVRNWLIKKLGGFTWEEYNRFRPRIIKIDERNLEPVRVEVSHFVYEGIQSEQYIRAELASKLATVIMDHAEIFQAENSFDFSMRYRAEILVARKKGGGAW